MKLRLIAYCSTAKHALSTAELDALRAICHTNNHRQHLCGYLHYHQGQFLQVLEGPAQAVEEVFARIRNDPQHHSFRLLLNEHVSRRIFANWSMGHSGAPHLPEAAVQRAQACFDKLHELDHVLATQILLICDQLMAMDDTAAAA